MESVRNSRSISRKEAQLREFIHPPLRKDKVTGEVIEHPGGELARLAPAWLPPGSYLALLRP